VAVTPPAPRAAYIHVPFCHRRCGYCNFTVLAGHDERIDDYLRALEIELRGLGTPRPVDTLFIGGGTPTRLPLPHWARLLDLVARWFPLRPGGEWTVEGNPEDVSFERVSVAVERGVTRWSLGVQSFLPWKRGFLEREHTGETIDRAIESCRQSGAQVAVDLIFALPDETASDWHSDLDQLLARPVQHVSTYSLTLEKGTAFWSRWYKGLLQPLEEDRQAELYLATRRRLRAAGFQHYEISNFALPGCRCRHNETYWLCGQYDAAGPGAARFVGGVREVNHRSTTTWMRRLFAGDSPVAERETIGAELAARERLIFGLRRLEGIDVREFEEATGFRLDALAGPAIDEFLAAGFLEQSGTTLRLSEPGILVSDTLWPALLG